jgi:hypothetical protein
MNLDSEIEDTRNESLSFIYNGLPLENPISAKLNFIPHLVDHAKLQIEPWNGEGIIEA